MPTSNADKFRLALEAVNRDDIEGALEHVDPKVEWRVPATLPDAETYYGHDGFRKWMTMMRETFEDLRIEPIGEFRELDESRVLVEVRASGRGRESGAEVSVSFFMLGTGRELLQRMEYYATEVDAFEAVGYKI